VLSENGTNFMRATPAGSETTWRTTGSQRAKNTPTTE